MSELIIAKRMQDLKSINLPKDPYNIVSVERLANCRLPRIKIKGEVEAPLDQHENQRPTFDKNCYYIKELALYHTAADVTWICGELVGVDL